MIVSFAKYHGAGNDFVMIDNRNLQFPALPEQVAFLCHRRFGIGADGLILLENSSAADFRMRYFNSDGLEGSMCGNGGRCISAFARSIGIPGDSLHFEAVDGMHESLFIPSEDGVVVKLKMADVAVFGKENGHYFLNTGSPHHVAFVKDVDVIDVYAEGKRIRYSDLYAPAGTNVNFVEVQGEMLFVRTYERGVEEETLSCGTGVTASALAYAIEFNKQDKVAIATRGGQLCIYFKGPDPVFHDVWLEGPAAEVYRGTIEIPKDLKIKTDDR
jgi:diaminopimelate epimerase